MNVLPLIHRELLVNARKPSTRRLRVGIALAALLVAGIFLFAMEKSRGFGVAYAGQSLFQILIWLGLATTGLFGVFFAADTLSEERREGTLGLLFLTPLRGHDVVLGKLAGTCLRSGYALLAALPVVALPLLLGGVTFTSYLRVALVLANTLFLSTAIGLMVSARTSDSVRAIMGTLALMLVLAGVPFWIDAALAAPAAGFEIISSYVSPAAALYIAAIGNSPDLWACLASQHVLAWLALALAARRTTRLAEAAPVVPKSKTARWLSAARPTRKQSQLRGREPIAWLVQRRSRGPTIVALLALILVGLSLFWTRTDVSSTGIEFFSGASFFNALIYFIVLVWLTVHATRRTSDGRRQGEFELLLATPISVPEIIRGHWHGLVRVFLVSTVIIAAGTIISSIGHVLQMQQMYANIPAGSGAPTALDYLPQFVVTGIFGLVGVLTTLAAVAWVGLWLGLTGENNAVSAAKVFVMVVVAPAIVLGIAQTFGLITTALFSGGTVSIATQVIAATVHGMLRLATDFAFIIWARRNLLKHFREAAGGTFMPRSLSIRGRFTKSAPAVPGQPA